MNRLFISLDFDEAFLEKLLIIRDKLADSFTGLKWESKNKLHLTLKFIGDIDASRTEKIAQIIEKVLNNYKEINLVFTGFSTFMRDNKPAILWAGFAENKLLQKLVTELEEGLNIIGIEKCNKKFKAHLTLMRLKGNESLSLIDSFTSYNAENFSTKAKSVTLFKSILKPTGSVYYEINKFEFK